jgi:rhomboid protease GluP
MKRRLLASTSFYDEGIRWQSVKTWLILCNIAMFVYEAILTIKTIKHKYSAYWPDRATEIVIDSVWGISQGPLAGSLGCSAAALQKQQQLRQAYRVLTSGFVHSSLVQLVLNMTVLQHQPSWLETGLGRSLYLSTFLWSIVAGNFMHFLQCASPWDRTLCLGASGGICGLYGLMYVEMTRMQSARGGRNLLRGMAILLLSGLWLDNVSLAANVGGFLCGIVTGILCGPRYFKDYNMRRKNSVEFDPVSRDYRQVMGFGISPTKGGPIPLTVIWTILLIGGLLNPDIRAMPALVWKKLVHPL